MTFASVLCLILIVLKLVGVIAWSWWWVLAPVWGPIALVGLFFGLMIATDAWTGWGRKPSC